MSKHTKNHQIARHAPDVMLWVAGVLCMNLPHVKLPLHAGVGFCRCLFWQN